MLKLFINRNIKKIFIPLKYLHTRLHALLLFGLWLLISLITMWASSTPALASSQQQHILSQRMDAHSTPLCQLPSRAEHDQCVKNMQQECKAFAGAQRACDQYEVEYCQDYYRIDQSCWNIDGDSTQTGGPTINDPQFSMEDEAFLKVYTVSSQGEKDQLDKRHKLKMPFSDAVDNKNNLSNDFFYFTPLSFTVKHSLIIQLWTVALVIVDAFIVVGVMLHGLNILLTGSYMKYSTALENLPKLFLALVVVHVSLLFVSVVLGLNNILCNFIYEWGNKQIYEAVYPISTKVTLTGNAGLKPEIKVLMIDWGPETMNFSDALGNFVDAAKMNIMEFALRMLALMLFVQVIMRLLFINFYIVTAPLALGCWALPGKLGGSVAGTWIKGFMSTVFVQLLQICAIVVINITQAGLFTYLRVDIQHSYLGNPDLVRIIQITIFLFLLRVPSLLGTAPMQTIMSAGSSIQQAASAAIGAGVAVATSISGSAGNAGGDLGSQAIQSLGKTIAARRR